MTRIMPGLAVASAVLVSVASANDSFDLQMLLTNISTNLNASSTSGATKKLESSLSAPSIVKVYTQRDIEKFDSIYDLLKTAPGVHIEEGHFGRQYINVRNIMNYYYNNKVLLIINGFKINDPTGPHINLDTIPKESIKRLEVIRGAGSVLYGSNAYAGVINIETFDGSGYDNNFASVTAGSTGVAGTSFGVFEKRENSNHFISVRLFEENGKDRARPGDYEQHRNLPNGFMELLTGGDFLRTFPGDASDYQLDYKNFSLMGVSSFNRFKVNYGTSKVTRNSSYQENAPVPFWGGVFDEARRLGDTTNEYYRDPATVLVPGSFHEPGRVRSYNTITQDWLGLEYNQKLSDRTSLKVLGKYAFTKERDQEFDLSLFNYDSDAQAVEFEVQAQHQVNQDWNLILGYNQERMSFEQTLHSPNLNTAANALIGTPVPANQYYILPPGKLQMDGIYLQSIYKVTDKLTFLAANRRNSHDHIKSGYTPKYALTYELKQDEFVKVIWGKAFRYPGPFELFYNEPTLNFSGSTALIEEKVESMEYNWSKSFDNGDKYASISYYDMKLTDLVYADVLTYLNQPDQIRAKGWEIEWEQTVSDRLGWFTNLSFMKYHDPSSGNQGKIPGQIEFKGSLGLDIKLHEKLNMYTNSRYLGTRQEYGTIYPTQPSSHIHDIGFVYAHSSNHRLRLDFLNVFDKDYRTIDYARDHHKMAPPPRGRRVQLSYQIEF
ncbi:MAG: TonB-dependent receptor [Candidatus Cloacimonetes bacterium]|nr:TonB-dependent receptor [Candidatus Cloacimonadota bacterium]